MKQQTKQQIIDFLNNNNQFVTGKVIMKVVDHTGNRFAPEQYCYKIFFTCGYTKQRKKFAVYPNTVGYQAL
jgi:hypothetical protein